VRLFIIGSTGQLGSDFLLMADELGIEVDGIHYPEIDLSDISSIENALADRKYDIIVNTAAYHGYDAYKDESPERYYAINVFGLYHLGKIAAERNAGIVTFSTDYVFSGNSEPTSGGFSENDPPIPANIYSASKLAGEKLLRVVHPDSYIFRVASLYGRKGCRAKNDSNFVEMVISKLSSGEEMTIVNNILMSPTSTESVIRKGIEVLQTCQPGLYHLAGQGGCTWYEFAVAVAELMDLPLNLLKPSTSDEVEQEIARGKNTVLINSKLRESKAGDMEHWRKSLELYLSQRP